jgi:hypothetical protein
LCVSALQWTSIAVKDGYFVVVLLILS